MYNKVLSGILVVLIIAIIGVLGYFGYGYYKKITLNADAKEYLEEFDTLVVELSKEQERILMQKINQMRIIAIIQMAQIIQQ